MACFPISPVSEALGGEGPYSLTRLVLFAKYARMAAIVSAQISFAALMAAGSVTPWSNRVSRVHASRSAFCSRCSSKSTLAIANLWASQLANGLLCDRVALFGLDIVAEALERRMPKPSIGTGIGIGDLDEDFGTDPTRLRFLDRDRQGRLSSNQRP